MSRKRSRPTPAIFYGYPVELIQQWCGVSKSTAYQYKCGLRKPSRQALRLFTLHREGRVLGAEWEGWRIEGGAIFDPEGAATSKGHLHAFGIMMQFAHSMAAADPENRERYNEILRSA